MCKFRKAAARKVIGDKTRPHCHPDPGRGRRRSLVNSDESFRSISRFQKIALARALGVGREVQEGAECDCPRPPGPFRTAEPDGSFHSSRQGAVHLAFSSPGRSPAAPRKENQAAPPAASRSVPGVECGTQ